MHSFGARTSAEEVAKAFSAEIKDKVVLTTGVSPGGLGAQFVQIIAVHKPKLLILAGRDKAKGKATAAAIQEAAPGVATRVLELDLSSQAQVRTAAAEVNAYEEAIDVLVLNAGLMAAPYGTTVDGVESQLGTNHIGHFLFANLIMGKVLAGNGGKVGRVVSVSSDGHRFSPIRWNDMGFEGGKTYEKFAAYGQAKTANILFAVALAEKLGGKGLLAYSLHPGVIMTNLGRHLEEFSTEVEVIKNIDTKLGNPQATRVISATMKTASQGTATHVVAAFDPSLADQNGVYLADCQVLKDSAWAKPYALDKGEARKLWTVSEEIVGQNFEY